MNYFDKINNLIEKISIDLKERDEQIRMSILAMLGGESIFLLGPPGVAKSLLSRKILEIVKDSKKFEYLMNRFSTPDEIFGPISIKKLEEDIYERKTSGYLPSAEIAFLDEIWKASPSIQNTLLTIINEKIYMNGNSIEKVPMLLLIAASNELPAAGEGLEALYDRFIIRMYVDNIMNKDNFRYVVDGLSQKDVKIIDEEKLTKEDILNIQKNVKSIIIDDNTFNFICELKDKLNSVLGKDAPYVSDRRWKKIVNLLKISAIASDRKEIKPSDWLIIKNMIWETEEQQEKILALFNEIWIDNVIKINSSVSISEADTMIDNLYDEFSKSYIKTTQIKEFKYNNEILIGFLSNDKNEKLLLLKKNDLKNIKNGNLSEGFTYYYTDREKKGNKTFSSLDSKYSYYNYFKVNKNSISLDSSVFFPIYETEVKTNKEELNKIKEKNIDFLKSLNQLNSNKEKLLKSLEEEKNLFSSSYNYQLKKLDITIEDSFKKLYEKSSKLSGEVLFALDEKDRKYSETISTKKDYDGKNDLNIFID